MSIVEVGPQRVPLYLRGRGREQGAPLLFLHGGWGYQVYPFDAQVEALGSRFRVLIPDRRGYGRSPRLPEFPLSFQRDAARDALDLLAAVDADRAVVWGHSDGAIIAVWMALLEPARCAALVLEATHYDRRKPRSRRFFELMVEAPERFGPRVVEALASDHGDPGWRHVLACEGRAWLEILDTADDPDRDLFGNRLADVCVPALVLHGRDDPRTEPGEIEAFAAALPDAELVLLDGAGHSPHTSASDASNRAVARFLERVLPGPA